MRRGKARENVFFYVSFLHDCVLFFSSEENHLRFLVKLLLNNLTITVRSLRAKRYVRELVEEILLFERSLFFVKKQIQTVHGSNLFPLAREQTELKSVPQPRVTLSSQTYRPGSVCQSPIVTVYYYTQSYKTMTLPLHLSELNFNSTRKCDPS